MQKHGTQSVFEVCGWLNAISNLLSSHYFVYFSAVRRKQGPFHWRQMKFELDRQTDSSILDRIDLQMFKITERIHLPIYILAKISQKPPGITCALSPTAMTVSAVWQVALWRIYGLVSSTLFVSTRNRNLSH